MRLTFLGTRANIDPRSERHDRHSSLLVECDGQRLMIDCGLDWLGKLGEIDPDTILITHTHPDHSFGLQKGAPCPVVATEASWERMGEYPLDDKIVISPYRDLPIGTLSCQAFPVDHSTVAPAVGYRLDAGQANIFYVPDVVWIRDREGALKDLDLYIGDGAAIDQSKVRKVEGHLVGHTPMRTQMTWCQKEGVERAVFTQCGRRIVESDIRKVDPLIQKYAQERQVKARVACDGMEIKMG